MRNCYVGYTTHALINVDTLICALDDNSMTLFIIFERMQMGTRNQAE